MSDWTDCGTYYLHNEPQGSKGWHSVRAKILTASNFGTAAGHNPYKTQRELAKELLTSYQQNQIDQQNEKVTPSVPNHHMQLGTVMEPVARQIYERLYGVKVTEVGLAIPKFDTTIGASVDGLVGPDGTIEIKHHVVFPQTLRDKASRTVVSQYGYQHIPQYHYDQMQGVMAVTSRAWCDYIVYSSTEDLLYTEKIPFNRNYWENDLYPAIKKFLTVTVPEVARGG